MRSTLGWITAFIITSIIIISCSKDGKDFLDPTDTGRINEGVTFSDSIRTMEFLNGIYVGIRPRWIQTDLTNYGSMSDCTDESELTWSGTSNYPVAHNNGVLTPTYGWVGEIWRNWFSMIRNANIYLKNVNIAPLSAGIKSRTTGEVKFLRAFYYHQLIRFFGGVPLIGDTILTPDMIINKPRNTYAQSTDYVIAELNEAANLLPLTHETANYGRATKGAALALKARVLLYAASPLQNGGYTGADGFNTSSAQQKELVSYPEADANRWNIAAQAYRDVIALNQYSLYEDNTTALGYGFYKVFHLRVNTEAIFQLMQGPNNMLESILMPPSRGGSSGSWPSQNIVDAFPMKDGVPIAQSSLYDPAKPYENRDPRFYNSIIYNGAMFRQRTTVTPGPVYTYQSAPTDGMGISTRTGYYNRKMLNNESTGNTDRCIMEIRYAEILLSLAEAVNEASGPTAEVYDAIAKIRKRAGLVPYELPAGLNKDQMREYIRNERRVELAFENHRYFDTRRWKIAHNSDIQTLRAIRWTQTAPNTYTRADITAEIRVFQHPGYYYFPIPQAEIGRQPQFIQNPGY